MTKTNTLREMEKRSLASRRERVTPGQFMKLRPEQGTEIIAGQGYAHQKNDQCADVAFQLSWKRPKGSLKHLITSDSDTLTVSRWSTRVKWLHGAHAHFNTSSPKKVFIACVSVGYHSVANLKNFFKFLLLAGECMTTVLANSCQIVWEYWCYWEYCHWQHLMEFNIQRRRMLVGR